MAEPVTRAPTAHFVAIPYPGRGHINPMMHLCTLLVSNCRCLTISFVVTEEWTGLIGSSPHQNIRLRSIANVIPSEHNRGADFINFLDAVVCKMGSPVDCLLDQLDLPISCIISDTYLPWVLPMCKRRNVPYVSFFTMAPSEFSTHYHSRLLAAAKGLVPVENTTTPVDTETRYELAKLPGMSSGSNTAIARIKSEVERIFEAFSYGTRDVQAIIMTSFYELQPSVIDNLRAKLSIPIYTIGPSIPYISLRVPPSTLNESSHNAVFQWLDSQPEASVLYVSLGSFLQASKEQMQELAMGLRASRFRYLWVARDDWSSLQEACDEKGLIVRWCDQLRVLCHSSVAGFLTHCGWNSTMESIFAGVPMLAFPLFVDQINNSKLIVEDWRVGLSLKQTVGTEHVVGSEKIADTVKRLMDMKGDEGKELRRRAHELREICRKAIESGGSTENNVNCFLRDFLQAQY